MKCRHYTLTGSKCRNPTWRGWPLCKGHLREASRELFQDQYGEGAESWAVITNPEEDPADIEEGAQ